MKRYTDSDTDITLMAYKNSYKHRNEGIKQERKNIQHRMSGVHRVDEKVVLQNLKQENDELKSKLSLVIEKDREIQELTMKLDQCKNIIAKYNLDKLDIDSSKKHCEILQTKLDAVSKALKLQTKKVKETEELNELLKQKLIEQMNQK
jgi:predicted RNase H-like nuclease (RuvC/YqgF family)